MQTNSNPITKSEMVVRSMPRDVQEALRSGRGAFSVPQWEHLVFGVTAWLLCGVAKLYRLASVVDGGHRTSLARFLSGAEWAAEELLRRVVRDQLRWMKPQRGEVLSLVIDEIKTAKRGKKMEALTKIWDHVDQRFVHGHILVPAAIVFRGVTLPWSFERWLPEKYGRDQKLALAADRVGGWLAEQDRRRADRVQQTAGRPVEECRRLRDQ